MTHPDHDVLSARLMDTKMAFIEACFPDYFETGRSLHCTPTIGTDKLMNRQGMHAGYHTLFNVFKAIAGTRSLHVGQRIKILGNVTWLGTATGEWCRTNTRMGFDIDNGTIRGHRGVPNHNHSGTIIGMSPSEDPILDSIDLDDGEQRFYAVNPNTACLDPITFDLSLSPESFRAWKLWLVSRDKNEQPPERYVDEVLAARDASRHWFDIDLRFAWFLMSSYAYDTHFRCVLVLLDSGELCAPPVHFFAPAW